MFISPPDPDPLAPLRDTKSKSGWRGVYINRISHDGKKTYRARVKRGSHYQHLYGCNSTDSRACAAHVAAWYLREYGPDWPKVLLARRKPPWAVLRHWSIRGRYYGVLWVRGSRHEVVELSGEPGAVVRHRNRVRVFASYAACRTGIEEYAARVLGFEGCAPAELAARLAAALYRTDKPRNRWMGKEAV